MRDSIKGGDSKKGIRKKAGPNKVCDLWETIADIQKHKAPPASVYASDLHYSDAAPLARAEKNDWNEVQFVGLRDIRDFCNRYKVPFFIAGDVFDKYKVSPETVNRTIEEFGQFQNGVFAIPGQHDLPYHNYADIPKSSYWTLVKAGVVTNMEVGKWFPASETAIVTGFPWNHDLFLPDGVRKWNVTIALVHKYIWHESAKYPGAPKAAEARMLSKQLSGFDFAFFGDNHKPFRVSVKREGGTGDRCEVFNCGGHAPRKSDERKSAPASYFYVLTQDNQAQPVPLVLDYKWIDSVVKEETQKGLDLDALSDVIKGIAPQTLDFAEAMNRFLMRHGVSAQVRDLILKSMEK